MDLTDTQIGARDGKINERGKGSCGEKLSLEGFSIECRETKTK